MEEKYKTALARSRTSHNLAIETGRYENISRDQRTCKSSYMNAIEEEYHFLLICPKYRKLRIKYSNTTFIICQQYILENLLSATSKTMINNFAKYIFFASKIRLS